MEVRFFITQIELTLSSIDYLKSSL